ncbi:hypothetical protein [Halomonas sp. PGE1]|uniref:hypothetical protein n=1 Tax=Halomonas sp. PGE1 TaxID=2730360 RepID=UPI00147545D7|nr:hypothetical protein [Halomonas sp. PGE1]QJQ98150.1 hypothetical protein HIR79_05210 [Halomonas sp. PGE1]
MIWHLIAAVFAGLGAAGIGMLLRMASGKRLPTWIIPVFGGLGMLGYQIHYEYSWFSHKQAQLPATASVVEVEHGSMFWRPWTYAFPMANAFSVVDRDSMAVRDANGERLVEYIRYRFEKQHVDLVTHQAWLINCATRETLPLIGEERRPRFEAMRALDEDDALYQALCRET